MEDLVDLEIERLSASQKLSNTPRTQIVKGIHKTQQMQKLQITQKTGDPRKIAITDVELQIKSVKKNKKLKRLLGEFKYLDLENNTD